MHEITLLQGLSLAALVFVLGIDFFIFIPPDNRLYPYRCYSR